MPKMYNLHGKQYIVNSTVITVYLTVNYNYIWTDINLVPITKLK